MERYDVIVIGAGVVGAAVLLELFNGGRGAAALPHNGVVNRPACGLFPYNRGFALVGNADGGKVTGVKPGCAHRFHQNADL